MSTSDPAITGDVQPLIGIVRTEMEALKIEKANPDAGIWWEEVPVSSVDGIDSLETLYILVVGGPFEEYARIDPSPIAAFSTEESALAESRRLSSLRKEDRIDALVWKVPLGVIDLSAPAWPQIEVLPG